MGVQRLVALQTFAPGAPALPDRRSILVQPHKPRRKVHRRPFRTAGSHEGLIAGGRALDDADGLAPRFLRDILLMSKRRRPEKPHFLIWVGVRVVWRSLRHADGEISIDQPPRLVAHLLGHNHYWNRCPVVPAGYLAVQR